MFEKARSWGCQEEKERWQGEKQGKQEEQGKRSGEEEEKRRRGRERRKKRREPCHVADNNPSLTAEVKQQVQSASSLLKWKFIGCPLIRNTSP